MYCINCGNKLNENDHFCGICGRKIENNVAITVESAKKSEPEIVYIEEKPMEAIFDNQKVVGLTLFILILSLVTIISISVFARNVPSSNKLEGRTSILKV